MPKPFRHSGYVYAVRNEQGRVSMAKGMDIGVG